MFSFGSPGWPRLRRCLLFLLTVVAVFAASLVAPVPTAQAAPSVSSVRVVPGTKQVTVAWASVPGATSYQVEVATNKAIKKPRKAQPKKGTTTLAVTKLKTNQTYYVRVTATTASGSVRSKVVKTRTTSASTGRGEITSVTGAGIDKIKVKWKGFAKATSLTLQISFDNEPISKAQKGKYFEVTKLPATATSAVVTIPKKFLPLVGSASGHPAYVRLVSYNGSKKSTSRIKYGWAGCFPAGEQGVRVAAYNVGNINAPNAPTWKARREAIRRSVELAAPDVLLVQEASTARAPSGLKEFEEVQSLLAGFALAYDAETVGTTDGGKTTKGDHIYYRTSKVRVIRAGLQSGKALPNTTWGGVSNRHFSWALLEQRDTGQRFYAVSVHLPTGTTKAVRTLRREVVRAIDEFIDRKNRNDGYPVIIGGDFNSSVMNVQDGPATELVKLGYVDAAAAPSRSGYRYSTSMSGWPSKPRSYAYTGTRIDYLMIKGGGGPSKWVNQIVLTKKGTFDEKYYGSDHALQWADFTWAPSGR